MGGWGGVGEVCTMGATVEVVKKKKKGYLSL